MQHLFRYMFCWATVTAVLLTADTVLAETVRKPVVRPGGGYYAVDYFLNGKRIARDTVDASMRVTRREGRIPDGEVVEYYPGGGVRYRWQVRSGAYTGWKQEYTRERRLVAEWVLSNGAKDGPAKTYYPDGTVKSELNYSGNRLNGVCRFYSRKGSLTKKLLYMDGREDPAGREIYRRKVSSPTATAPVAAAPAPDPRQISLPEQQTVSIPQTPSISTTTQPVR